MQGCMKRDGGLIQIKGNKYSYTMALEEHFACKYFGCFCVFFLKVGLLKKVYYI